MNWKFWRKPGPTFVEQFDAWTKWESDMLQRGFQHWLYQSPPDDKWVEVSRREWPTIAIWQVATVRAETNIANLWWREARCDITSGGIIEMPARA